MTQEPKTNKGKYNAIIRKAEKLDAQLSQLREKAQELADSCRAFGDECDYDTYIYSLANLAQVAEDLAAFDLEDAIPERARCDF